MLGIKFDSARMEETKGNGDSGVIHGTSDAVVTAFYGCPDVSGMSYI